jgi:hypothetical protein
MKTRSTAQVFLSLFLFLVTACSLGAPAATPTPTLVPSTPTNTLRPTSTPRPTATPNVAATQMMEDVHNKVASYKEAGYLNSADGNFFKLDDYFREMAKKNYLDVDFAGYENLIKNFAVWGHIKMQSAREVSGYEYSGCGFSFRINPTNFDGYTVHLTTTSVLMSYCDSSIGSCGRIGKTTGTGKVDLPNPTEADMELVVRDTQAYVLVNGEFVGEYSLFTEKLIDPGYLLYSIISGTNAEYGTRCEISDAGLWIAK